MSSLWLSKKKKPELQEMWRSLGFEPGEKLRSHLETDLAEYLSNNETEYTNHPIFSAYYETLATRSPSKAQTAAAMKNRRQSVRHHSKASSDVENTPEPSAPVAPTPRRNLRDKPQPQPGTGMKTRSSVSREGTPGSVTGSAIGHAVDSMLPETPRNALKRLQSQDILPMSPGDLADAIETRTIGRVKKTIKEKKDELVARTELWEKVAYTRETLSNVNAVHALVAAYEFSRLVTELLPVHYYLASIPLPFDLPTMSKIVNIPDFFILLSWNAFWGPVTFWALHAIFVPLIVSYFVNLSSTKKYDPLVFSITKALISYTVYSKQWFNLSAGGVFSQDTSPLVGSIVGEEIPLIGAGVAGLTTLWDAILKTR